ncbi:MAG: hypothetical protein KDC98_08335 [Planctomycetes bacterium]|nr:hypothetical protein [Planctomycetota bacterium]
MRVRRGHLAVAALAITAFAAALLGAFVFDDIHSVVANRVLHDGSNWWRWLSDPEAFSTSGKMYRPVVLLSLGLNLQLGASAASLKAGNVLIHALVATLAFGWLRRFGLATRAAFAVAALFAVHPLASEAINLVSARSELLLEAGMLIALRAHLNYCRGGAFAKAAAGIVAGTVIACGSKETAVVLPGLLLVQAYLVRRAPWRAVDWGRAVRVVLPAVALVVAYLVLRKLLLGEATVSLAGRTGADPLSGHGRSFVCQLATMGVLLPQAVLQMVCPVGLSLDPSIPFRQTLADPLVIVGWASTLGLLGLGLLPGPNAAVRRFGVAFAVATALPWVVIPLNVPLAEHRLYGPLLGLLLMTAPWLPRPGVRTLALAGLLLVGIVQSNARSLDYRDEVRCWLAELERADSWRAWWGLGAAHLRDLDFAAAVPSLARAHAGNPQHATVLRNYAEALSSLPDDCARPDAALAVTAAYLAARPNDPWARTLSAQANLQAGRVRGDRDAFLAAERIALSCLEVAEPKGLVFRMAAAARRGLGDLEGALAHLDQSLAIGRDHVSVRLDRAAVLRDLGREREAMQELMCAQRQAPTDAAVMRALRAAQPPR